MQPEPTVSSGDGAGPGPDAADAGARATRPSPRRTSCARTAALRNQPAVMNSIAGLFGIMGGRLHLRKRGGGGRGGGGGERATPRSRRRSSACASRRRDIADKAAKGFSDMKAYYEAELRNAKTAAEGDGAPDGADVPRACWRARAGSPGTWTRPRCGARCPRKASFWLCARSRTSSAPRWSASGLSPGRGATRRPTKKTPSPRPAAMT